MDPFGLGYSLYFTNNSIGREKTVNDLGRITVNPIPYHFLTSLKIVSSEQKTTAEPVRTFQPVYVLHPIIEGRSSNSALEQSTINQEIEVRHPNPSYYQITINNGTMEQWNPSTSFTLSLPNVLRASSETMLILSQSFDKAWKAYEVNGWLGKTFPFIFGKELKEHVLVNNWQNGWILDNLTIEQLNNLPAGRQGETIVIFYLPQLLEYLGFGVLITGVIWLIRSKVY